MTKSKKGQITKKTNYPIRRSGSIGKLYLSDLLELNCSTSKETPLSHWLQDTSEVKEAYYGSRGARSCIKYIFIQDMTNEEYLVWLNLNESVARRAYLATF